MIDDAAAAAGENPLGHSQDKIQSQTLPVYAHNNNRQRSERLVSI